MCVCVCVYVYIYIYLHMYLMQKTRQSNNVSLTPSPRLVLYVHFTVYNCRRGVIFHTSSVISFYIFSLFAWISCIQSLNMGQNKTIVSMRQQSLEYFDEFILDI